MEIEFVLKKLKEQRNYLPTTNLETWFPATYKYIVGYFENDSSEAIRFRELKQRHVSFSGFSKQTLGMYSGTVAEMEKNNKADFLKEVAGVLEEIIEILEHDVENQKQLLSNLATKALEKNESIAVQEAKVITKTQLPFGIKAELFWGIMVVIIGFAYWLGTKLETYQIHEENREVKQQLKNQEQNIMDIKKLKEQVKQLQIDTIKLKKTIREIHYL